MSGGVPAGWDKQQAYRAVRSAIERGDLVRPPFCSRCAAPDTKATSGRHTIQAHHHAGYDRPLNVEWLCAACHRRETPLPVGVKNPVFGERNGSSKLTDQQVADIRSSTDGCRILARRFGVHRKTVQRIRNGQARTTPTSPIEGRDADVERWHSRKIVECEFRLGDCVRCGKRADRLNQRDPCFQPAGRHGHPLHPEVRAAVVSMETQRSAIWAKARQYGLSAEESANLALDAVANARAALQALGERG